MSSLIMRIVGSKINMSTSCHFKYRMYFNMSVFIYPCKEDLSMEGIHLDIKAVVRVIALIPEELKAKLLRG